MGKGKRWTSDELEKGAIAYRQASMNSVKGTAQKVEVFAAEVLKCMREIRPPGVEGLGRYDER